MNCKDARSLIDESLTRGVINIPNEARNHIDSCPGCAAYFAETADLRSMLDQADPKVYPRDIDDLTFEKIVDDSAGRTVAPGQKRFDLRGILAPVAAAAIIIFAMMLPKMAENDTNSITYEPEPIATSVGLINNISNSDSLSDEVISEFASDIDIDNLADAIIEGSNIDDLLSGLTQSEMEALYIKIDELKG